MDIQELNELVGQCRFMHMTDAVEVPRAKQRVTVAMLRKEGEVSFGISIRNPKDKSFNKEVAKRNAAARASVKPQIKLTVDELGENVNANINKVLKHIKVTVENRIAAGDGNIKKYFDKQLLFTILRR